MTSRLFPLLLLVAIGCGSGSGVEVPDTTLADIAIADTALPEDTFSPVDTMPLPDVAPSNACEPGTGCFEEPCSGADDCQSGICTMHLGEKVCSKTCDASCPDGWSCTLVTAGGSDGMSVCTSNFSHLCLPCGSSEGCGSDNPTACVNYAAGGSFCGGACDLETPCPTGYSCQEVETTANVKSYQCVADSGMCVCSDLAIESSLSTPCTRENEYGSCQGTRACTEGGLADCDAKEPAAEICNGIDDDCDGNIDEDTCDDGNGCTIDGCGGEGGCTHEALDTGECLDGDACTMGDHCEAGVCVGTPIDCDDGNLCTEDACDGNGGCTNTPLTIVCDDGDPCTVGDVCKEGACVGSVTLDCDDGNPCTDDSCGDTGCIHTANTAPCDDANACTTGSTCADGACVATEAVLCDDLNPCTDDACNPSTGCTTTANTLLCDDGDTCTLKDACADGVCVSGKPLVCDDGNPCTADACSEGVCVTTPADGVCDDGNACTTASECKDGACTGTEAAVCDDGDICTDDSCIPATGCTTTPNSAPCNDDNACTQGDSCADGTCAAGPDALVCNDGNICTDDSCDPVAGCIFATNNAACDDGNACTIEEACSGGWCLSTNLIACGDGNPCTDDTCDPVAGCVVTNNEAACDDENPCTVGDTCGDGACQPGTEPLACDDGQFCNGLETCDVNAGCIPGVPVNLDDGVGCTIDSCDEENDIVAHTPSSAGCNVPEGVPCVSAVCDAQTGCSTVKVPNCCGNGIVEGNEECDDENSNNGDGCTNTCIQNSVTYGPVHTFNGHQAEFYIGIGQGNCSKGSAEADAKYFCKHFYNASCTPKPGYYQTSTNANQEWVMHKNGGCTSNGEDIPGKTCENGPCKIGMWSENLKGLKGLVCVCGQ